MMAVYSIIIDTAFEFTIGSTYGESLYNRDAGSLHHDSLF